MTPIILGAEIRDSSPKPDGVAQLYAFTLDKDQSITIETSGSADVLVNVYGPFQMIQQSIPENSEIRMFVQGVGRWANKELMSGNYLAAITQNTPGSYFCKIRQWQIGDKLQVELRGK